MLKCNINSKGLGRVTVRGKGAAEDLAVEAAMAIKVIYRVLHQKSPEDAEKGFKNRLIGLLLDPKSPVWDAGD